MLGFETIGNACAPRKICRLEEQRLEKKISLFRRGGLGYIQGFYHMMPLVKTSYFIKDKSSHTVVTTMQRMTDVGLSDQILGLPADFNNAARNMHERLLRTPPRHFLWQVYTASVLSASPSPTST
jgi:hypothetical protein